VWQVCGTSMYLGQKHMPVGGTDKLPQDFVKASRYVGDDQVGLQLLYLRVCFYVLCLLL
jgi:hypothetical protein